MLTTKTNPELSFKLENGKLLFKDENCVMDNFEETEFLFAGDAEYNQAVIQEIEVAFQVKIIPSSLGVFDYQINFLT